MDPSLLTDEELRARRIVVLGTCQHCGQIAAVHVEELAEQDASLEHFRAFVRAWDALHVPIPMSAAEVTERAEALRQARAAITAQDMGEA